MTAAAQPHRFDHLTAEVLRARGSLKWSTPAEIAAWVAESDFGLAPPIARALHDAVDAGLTGYLPPGLRQELGQACTQWYRERYGWTVAPGWVHPVGDVLEALRTAVAHFSRPDAPVVVPTPAYMPFLSAPLVWGRRVIQVPMTPGTDGAPTLDLAAVESAFAGGADLFVLTNPHNPTGRVHTRAELLALAEVVERHGARVFADEIHAPLVHPGSVHVPYASLSSRTAAHTVTATSASKAWNVPGLKCAQVLLSNEADAARWEPMDHALTAGASTFGALATGAAYTQGGPWLDEVIAYLDGNRHAFAETVAQHGPHLGHRRPEGTYLAWLDARDAPAWPTVDGSSDRLGRWLLEHAGVAVVDGALCGEAGRGFVRVNLAMPRALVIEAARRVATCLEGPASTSS